jgi:hypothetical protein
MPVKRDPASVLDLTRAPRGELAAALLVTAAAQHGDLAERHYLELKGPSDLTSKVSRQKLAKFILGAANRMPDRAAEAFEGFGVMIVGITANGAEGVPPVEMLTLAQVIQPVLGADGPRWDIVRVPVPESSKEVVVILVDPPKMGQSPFVCRASGEGLQDGRIYYRADGETREPTSGEWDQLMARAAVEPAAPVEIEVSVVGAVTSVKIDEEHTLEEFITTVRRRLISALPTPEPTKASSRTVNTFSDVFRVGFDISRMAELHQSSVFVTEEPETRTEDDYRHAIARWETSFRAAWPEAVELFVRHSLPPNEISITNKTQTFLHDVEVKIHLQGPVTTLETQYAVNSEPTWADLKLPDPPRKWGPVKTDLRNQFGGSNYAALLPGAYAPSRTFLPSNTSWANGGSVDVTVNAGDLRPKAVFESDDGESILVIGEQPSGPVRGTWEATIRGYNETFSGELKVDITEPADLTSRMREFLNLS